MCLCVHIYMAGVHRGSEMHVRSPGAGIPGICQLPNAGAESELYSLMIEQ